VLTTGYSGRRPHGFHRQVVIESAGKSRLTALPCQSKRTATGFLLLFITSATMPPSFA
jgi:hypothetical protein